MDFYARRTGGNHFASSDDLLLLFAQDVHLFGDILVIDL